MYWKNTETPTFAGSDGRADGSPDVAEAMVLYDRDGVEVSRFTKTVAGALSMEVGGELVAALDAVDSTELSYLDGVTSAIQTQLDARMFTKIVTFTENATNTLHTGTVTLPAGAWLHDIQVTNRVLWTGGTATMKVGDTADDDGYFTGINLKATDLLVGEVLSIQNDAMWGGKEGAYLVAATGQRGPTTTNFGLYYAAGSDITGIITVGTPATTAGRTFMSVTYSIGAVTAAVASTP